jgi:sn-glycerol 3-phosphate transport system ATP-binding protein/multiple sugar transport system ATP-binding protein
MAALTLEGIQKKLGENQILKGIDLEVGDGQLVVLVGPSGCGKSTLLRTIAGLELPDAGSVQIGDRDVTRLAPRDRDIAMVFQSYALYPHLTVRDNLAFGLKLRGEKPDVISSRIKEVSAMLGLGDLLLRLPRELSGGQRQRVAMGRAVARRADLYLLDEPLSNLDAALRAEVRVEIKKLHAELQSTMVYVTHDQVEAMTLADVLVVLNAGRVEQAGSPLEVYEEPTSRFVASFMGSPSMNFLEARIEKGKVIADGVELTLGSDAEDGDVLLGIRPHDVVHADDVDAPPLSFDVEVVEAMGFEAYAHGTVGAAPFIARIEGEVAARTNPGDRLSLSVAPERVHLFDPKSERAIR